MKRKIAITSVTATVALVALAATPGSGDIALAPLGAVASAQAAVTKSLDGAGAGGGSVSGAGNRFGDLLSGWGVPVLTALAGFLLIGTLASRNVGASVGIVVITLVGLIFLLSPQSIESFAKGIANVVF